MQSAKKNQSSYMSMKKSLLNFELIFYAEGFLPPIENKVLKFDVNLQP